MNQEYQNWLDGLKVGDEVYCTWGERIEKITHITKGRQIDIGKIRYKDGSYKGKDRWDMRHYIEPVTQAILDKIEQNKLANNLSCKLCGNAYWFLSVDQLRRISVILEESNAQK
ncbi:MAG: hypothetical protein GX639_10020 [Fibrobacter sp.]|nr:hypothetical protein [Fibrobacter sp.]